VGLCFVREQSRTIYALITQYPCAFSGKNGSRPAWIKRSLACNALKHGNHCFASKAAAALEERLSGLITSLR
jgi:hypothetical protein